MKKLLLIVFLLNPCATFKAQTISTIAGTGTWGPYTGDGGPATSAILDDLYFTYPAFDGNGNMYFGQGNMHTIRKIDKFGIITTIAGQAGVIGYSGDGGPAKDAQIYRPTSIAVDKNNNIYFADQVSTIIRKIDANGIITTVSGMHSPVCGNAVGKDISAARFSSISGMVFDQSNNLIISDYGCDVVYKVNPAGFVSLAAGNFIRGYSGDGGPATSAQLAYPCKPGVDVNGNIFIADAQNHRIRKVSASGIITTVAGSGAMGYSGDGGPATAASFKYPGSVVVDKAGNLYVGDNERVIRKIDPSGIVTTFAGNGAYGYTGDGGPAISASMVITQGRISIDANDHIYFCDDRNFVIRKISNCLSSSYVTQPANDTLCSSGVAKFSVSVLNAGTLQWQENKGQGWVNLNDNTIYSGTTTPALVISVADVSFNNFQYRCVATNDCGDVYSQTVKLAVTNPLAPQLTISTSSAGFCAGTSVIFNSAAVNGGTAPVYQWKKNGSNVGINTATYTDNSLINGDVISCILTSNSTCITSSSAASNVIPVTVYPLLVPSVSINASANTVCSGTGIVFTAVPVNGGASPAYQWKKNGISTGTNGSTFTDNTLSNGDMITSVLTSNEVCKTAATAQSNPIVMNIIPPVTPVITINASKATACAGTVVTFTSTITGGGISPIYQWKKNGVNSGSNAAVYQDNNLKSGDIISCALTSNSNCLAVATVTSNPVSITILNTPAVNLDKSTALCTGSSKILDAGNYISWLWNDGSTSRTLTVNKPGTYSVTVTDMNGCRGFDTAGITSLLPLPTDFLPVDTSVCVYDKLTLFAKQGYSSYLWNNSAGGTAITVSTPGLYWLEVKDQFSCIGRDSVLVKSKDCLSGLFVPNAFTPNNDHLNDVIHPFIGGKVVFYEFSIFNRWGTMVFTTKEINKGWDGRWNGYPQDPGMFSWKCIYQFEGEKKRTERGIVVLVR